MCLMYRVNFILQVKKRQQIQNKYQFRESEKKTNTFFSSQKKWVGKVIIHSINVCKKVGWHQTAI